MTVRQPVPRPFPRYLLTGVASMASAEFQGHVLLRASPGHFLMAMALYAVLSAIAYAIGRRVRHPQADLWFYGLGGLLGMVVIEWYAVGFYPGSGRHGIHAAMFTNWAAVFTLPRLFTSPPAPANQLVRRRVKWTVIAYSLGAPLLVLASPIPKGGAVALLMAAYSILLSFELVPFLVETRRARMLLVAFNVSLLAAAAINVICCW